MICVLTTVANRADADKLAQSLIEAKLAACVQIESIHSVYRWDGKLCQGDELRLLIKSSEQKQAELIAWLEREHPYKLPAIVVLPAETTEAFSHWIDQSCS
jgi:periplasmic divalent cation tolerance protein